MSNKSNKKPNHIIIPNEAFRSNNSNTEKVLELEELYLYAWMYRRRYPEEWVFETSIDHINNFCYKFGRGDDSRNKRIIKEMLINLESRNYISTVEGSEIHKKMKNSDTFALEFPFVNGYNENITYKLFDQFNDPLEFYIYAYIDCFGVEGRTISYYMWSRILRRSETTVKEVLNKMNTYDFKPRIWKFSGDYYKAINGSARQEMNTYYTRPDEDTIKKWNGFYAEGRSEVKELAFGYRGGGNGVRNKNGLEGVDGYWGSVEDMF